MWCDLGYDFEDGIIFRMAVSPFYGEDIEYFSLEGDITGESWMNVLCAE